MSTINFSLAVMVIVILLFCDLLARFAQKNTCDGKNYRPAGLLGLLLLSLTCSHGELADKPATIKRMWLSIGANLSLLAIIIHFLTLDHQQASEQIFLIIISLLISPFYHVVTSLLSRRQLDVAAGLNHFAARLLISLTLCSNAIFILFVPSKFQWAQIFFFAIYMVGLFHLFTLLMSIRAKPSTYHLDNHENQSIHGGFFYYLVSHLEFFLAIFLIYVCVGHNFFTQFFEQLYAPYFFPSFAATIILIVFIAATIKPTFFQTTCEELYFKKIIPLSFFLFGSTMVLYSV